jgi:hypothetical protein
MGSLHRVDGRKGAVSRNRSWSACCTIWSPACRFCLRIRRQFLHWPHARSPRAGQRMAGSGEMRCSPRPLSRVLLVALCLAAPALAAAAPGTDNATDAGIDNSGLNVTRHAMPPDVIKPAESANVSANPLWAIPLSALAATLNRPLFTPSRRPQAPVVASAAVLAPRPPPPPPASEHPNLALVGTVAAGNEDLAVLIDPMTHDAVRLRTGEGHQGWILQSVDRRTATLQKGGQSETLELPRPIGRP